MKQLFALLGRLLRFAFRPLVALASSLALRFSSDAARRRRRARRLAAQLVSELARLGFTRKIVTDGRRRRGRVRRQRVTFEQPLLMTADELWCPVDLPRLPTGVTTDDLRDEVTLRSLQDRTDCSVRIDYLANGKLCYVVRYGGAAFPSQFTINQVEFPEGAGPLAIPAGVNADADQVFIDLDEVVHLLIAGATGNGKTVLLNAALTSLINRNTADDLELWLVDLKQTEFNLYRPLLSKKGESIVRALAVEPEEAIDLLDRAMREINRRNQLMAQHNATSLDDLVQSTGVRLRKVVIVLDEFAQLTLNTSKLGKQSIGKIAENLLTRIAALGRSAGFRIVIATQMVQSAVVSSLIRANFENRLAFSTADWRQSQLVIESSEADGLPKGRAVMRVKGVTTMVQTALITSRQVRIEVDRVAHFGPNGAWGEDLELARFVRDAKLLISVGCQQFAGEVARSKVLALDGVRGVISFDRFNEVCQRLERDGVLEPGRSNKPRRVSKGFFNRPGLLDNLYGLPVETFDPPTGELPSPATGPTMHLPPGPPWSSTAAVGEHQEAEQGESTKQESAVRGAQAPAPLQESTELAEEADPPPPSWWGQIDPAAAAAAPAPARARPRVARGRKGARRR